VGKSDVLEHKSGNISETRSFQVKKLLYIWTTYRNSPTLFRTVPYPTPYGLLFPKIPRLGVRKPTKKLKSLLSQQWMKLRT